jgi:hypothetical protein
MHHNDIRAVPDDMMNVQLQSHVKLHSVWFKWHTEQDGARLFPNYPVIPIAWLHSLFVQLQES